MSLVAATRGSTEALTRWKMAQTAPGRFATPDEIDAAADWIEAFAPGTAADALERAGRFDREAPLDLDDFDHWYRADLFGEGRRRIVFHGLATLAEIFVDGVRIATSESMFAPCAVDMELRGRARIDIAFRAMASRLAQRGPRARWRPRAVQPATMRFVRATLIGRMPGWSPNIRAVGPWRGIDVLDPSDEGTRVERVVSRVEGSDGVLDLTLAPGPAVRIGCAGAHADVAASAQSRAVSLRIANVALWHPHTHGAPILHEATAEREGSCEVLGRVGFRTIAIDRDADGRGFGLVVNGVPVFCRGANWISPDIVRLGASRERYRELLTLARDANMNMIRVPGSTVYEDEAFYEVCDELGLLVWQDFMFANLDYPAQDESFRALVAAEADAFLSRTQWSPSLAVFCGGAEVAQQAAMLGLPKEAWSNAIFEEALPRALEARRPGAIYAPNTPMGGDMPFQPDAGLCHYYGVSAYQRGFDDIRRARVRFAPECLGFSHLPEQDVALEQGRAAAAQPVYGERVENDKAALWYFEGVRNQYVQALYGVDCDALRLDDPARFLDLSRAVTGEVATELYAEWRSAGSPTRGGLTLFYQDVAAPGAGFGVVDHLGAPKPVWHALRRAFSTIALTLTDEGLNGLRLTLINETATSRDLDLVFECLRDGAVAVASATRRVRLDARSVVAATSSELLGRFFDASWAYRFGEPSHDVVVARLVDPETGETAASATFFPLGRGSARVETGVSARLERGPRGWSALVTALRVAQNVRMCFDAHRALDNWFHLAPRETRRVALQPLGDSAATPRGTIGALNDARVREIRA